MRHRNEGGSTSAEGRGRKREDPSLFIPEAGGVPVPFPGVSSSGAPSSLLAHVKQIVTGRRGGRVEEGVSEEAGTKWSHQDFL